MVCGMIFYFIKKSLNFIMRLYNCVFKKMPLKGEAHEISFKNVLKYISFPLQFFKVKTNYSLPN